MCVYPITAWQFVPGQKPIMRRDKAVKELISRYPGKYLAVGDDQLKEFELLLPCGNCTECSVKASEEWAFRILDECKYHEQSCVLTLTYAVEPPELIKSDYQNFLKRLRYHIDKDGKKIRQFVSGEYGSKTGRPHFHIIIFGWKPDDVKFHHFNSHGRPIFTSKFVETVWGLGFVSVDNVDYEVAKYSAKYLQKQVRGQAKEDKREPPFITMSLKPGIGLRTIPATKILEDKVFHRGKSISLPRYYLKLLERQGADIEPLKAKRRLNAKLRLEKPIELREYDFKKMQKFLN